MENENFKILALKYRPKTFEQVVGQNHVVKTLSNALQRGKIGQAYLFSGMRGVGKTSVARILAKALNCVHGPTPTPCNNCEFCEAINDDRAIDVLEIDGAASRKVEEARDLREGLQYQPLHSRYKVVIIDEVHMLTPEAFATLLKILEEPPPQTVFIFATTEAHKIPKTIVSRCQHFEFNRISQKDIVKHLAYIAEKEEITVSQEGLYLIAEAAEGSLRDAESILDKAIAFAGKEITIDDIKILLGTVPQKILFEVSSIIFNGDSGAVFSIVDKLVESGYELINFYHQLIHHFRKFLLAKSVSNFQDFIPVSEEEYQHYVQEASKVSEEDLLRYLNALLKEEGPLKYSFQPRIYLETILVKLCHFSRLVALEELLKTVSGEGGEKHTFLGAQTSQEKERSFSSTSPNYIRSSIKKDLTPQVESQKSKAEKKPLSSETTSEKVMTSKPIRQGKGREEKTTRVSDTQPDILIGSRNQSGLKKDSASSFQAPLATPPATSPPSPPSSSTPKLSPDSPRPRKLKDKLFAQALEDPQVKEFLELFKAQILSIQPLSSWDYQSPTEGIKAKRIKKEGVKQ